MAESPVAYEVDYAESLDRPAGFYKWILAFPHYFILYFYGIVAFIFAIIAWVNIYRLGTFPRNSYDFIMGFLRWTARTYAYALCMRDEYPPFADEEYPVRVDVPYPEGTVPKDVIIQFIKVIPAVIMAWIFGFVYFLTVIFAAINIFRTGRYPEGLFRFAVSMQRWYLHIYAYAFGIVQEYPPLSVDMSGVQLRIEPQEPQEPPPGGGTPEP
jgi:hypothetical protein